MLLLPDHRLLPVCPSPTHPLPPLPALPCPPACSGMNAFSEMASNPDLKSEWSGQSAMCLLLAASALRLPTCSQPGSLLVQRYMVAKRMRSSF